MLKLALAAVTLLALSAPSHAALQLQNRFQDRLLNPQPLPPSPCASCPKVELKNPFTDRLLNPQPLPPRSNLLFRR
jgi:hypothetical protein